MLESALTNAGMKFTQTAYAVAPGSTGVAYFNNDNGTDFALMAKSKSGKTFYYSSKDGITKEYTNTAQPLPGYTTQIKTFLGMNGSPNGWGLSSSGVWATWTE